MFDTASGQVDSAKSQHFMRQLGKVYVDTSELNLGYKSSNTFCITPAMMTETDG